MNTLLYTLGVLALVSAVILAIRLLLLGPILDSSNRARDYARRAGHTIDNWKWRRASARDALDRYEIDQRFIETIQSTNPDEKLRVTPARLWSEAVMLAIAVTLLVLAGRALIAPGNVDIKAAETAEASAAAELNEWAVQTYGLAADTDLSTFTDTPGHRFQDSGCEGVTFCKHGTVFQGDQLVDVTVKRVGDEYILLRSEALESPELPRVEKVGKHNGK